MDWETIYNFFGIKDFIYFISSPGIQDMLFPIKLVFILFTAFFLCAVIYFYINSSYLKYQFLQDVTEFFSWRAYGLREIDKRLKKIIKKAELGSETEYKLAIIEADDFLRQVLEEADYKGETFEELVNGAGRKILPNIEDILEAHNIRNSMIHDVNYKLDLKIAKKVLSDYEKAIKGAYVL